MIIETSEILRLLTDRERRSEGFALLVDAYTEPLYWHLRRMVVVHEEAEDTLQEVWIKIFSSIESYRGDAEGLRSWCYRIATNAALDRLRRRCRWRFVTLDSIGHTLSKDFTHEVGESADSIEGRFQQALLALPTKQRLVFNLRYYDELEYSEISRITGISEGACKTNYHYAQQRVKEMMTR
ncbi:MAG: RNA polymerase sigma factor [Rikenellaceae bacterium]|nr:RNA polymerase sigma factor [Rikenellaceae bacterium]MBQ7342235.1 RNA polymerase sigma factor [Alistipes sp.]